MPQDPNGAPKAPPKGRTLTMDELASLAYGPGNLRDEGAIAIAVAIAMRESRGKTDAINVNKGGPAPGSHDVGLWQINTHYHPQWTEAQLLDPDTNAYAMGQLSNLGTQWGPWEGASYQQWMPGAKKAAAKIAKNGDPGFWDSLKMGAGIAGEAVADNPMAALSTALGAIADALGSFLGAVLDVGWWKRVGLGVASVIIIAAGVSLVSRDALLPPQLQALMNLATKVK